MSASNGRSTPRGTVSAYPTLARPATKDHLFAKPKPWRIVEVCFSVQALNDLVAAEVDQGKADLAAQRAAGEAAGTIRTASGAFGTQKAVDAAQEALKAAREHVEACKAAVSAETREVLFVAVGRRRYAELIEEFSSTPEPTEDAPKPEPIIADRAAFNRAVVAVSCQSIELTREDLEALSDEWNVPEFDRLVVAALEVNTSSRLVELGKVSRPANA